MSKLFCVY